MKLMPEFEKVLELTSDSKVELSKNFKELLHKELCLGMTRYVCRYGTLGEGHEKILDSQRYYQAIREAYGLSLNMPIFKAQAMEAQADILDAQEELITAIKESAKLRLQAKLELAQGRLLSALTSAEDQMRQLDEFTKVINELQPSVRAKYPLGIEQAEQDHWEAIARYRIEKEQKQQFSRISLDNIPLEPEYKAKLGYVNNRKDMAVAYALQIEDKLKEAQVEHKAS